MAMYSSHLLYRWAAGAAGLTMSAFIRTQAFTKFSCSVEVRNLAFFLTPKVDLLQIIETSEFLLNTAIKGKWKKILGFGTFFWFHSWTGSFENEQLPSKSGQFHP
jgi:hypothetical protein